MRQCYYINDYDNIANFAKLSHLHLHREYKPVNMVQNPYNPKKIFCSASTQ